METFTLSRKELHRPGLLKALCAGRVTTRQVANALGVSLRQTRRLRRRFEARGAAPLAPPGRRPPPPPRMGPDARDPPDRQVKDRFGRLHRQPPPRNAPDAR